MDLSGVSYYSLKQIYNIGYWASYTYIHYMHYMQYTVFEAYQIRIVKICCAALLINVEIYYYSSIIYLDVGLCDTTYEFRLCLNVYDFTLP
jgi:hypothetical protein